MRDSGVTIVLVTHFMEEAERLCDRVALIDHGKVIALVRPRTWASRRQPPNGSASGPRTNSPTRSSWHSPR